MTPEKQFAGDGCAACHGPCRWPPTPPQTPPGPTPRRACRQLQPQQREPVGHQAGAGRSRRCSVPVQGGGGLTVCRCPQEQTRNSPWRPRAPPTRGTRPPPAPRRGLCLHPRGWPERRAQGQQSPAARRGHTPDTGHRQTDSARPLCGRRASGTPRFFGPSPRWRSRVVHCVGATPVAAYLWPTSCGRPWSLVVGGTT